MANVGDLALQMSASPAGMAEGLKQAEAIVKSSTAKLGAIALAGATAIGTTLPAKIKAGFASVLSLGQTIGGYLEKVYKDPIKAFTADVLGGIGSLASKVPVIGGLLALPFQAAEGSMNFLLDTYKAGVDRVKELGASAARVNVPIGQFQVLEKIAGSSEAAEKAINKMHLAIANASLAAEGAHTPFTALGLDARTLARQDVLTQWGMLGDALLRVGNTGLQVRAAFEILGKSGPSLLQPLLRGSQAVRDMQADLDKFGVGLSAGVLFSIKQAGMAKKQIEFLKEGFSNQVVMAVAPMLAQVSSLIGKLPGGFKGLAGHIVTAFEEAAKAVALFIDAMGDSEVRARAMESVGKRFSAAFLDAIAEVIKALPSMRAALYSTLGPKLAKLLEITPVGSVFSGLFGILGEDGNPIAKSLEGAAKARRAEADAADAALKALGAAGRTPALDFIKKQFAEIRARMNAVSNTVGQVDDTFQIFERGLKLQESLTTPLEKARDALLDIQQLQGRPINLDIGFGVNLGAGMPLLDQMFPGLAERGAFKAFQDFRNASGMGQMRFAGAMEQGSKEAYSTILANQEKPRLNVQQEIKAILEAQKRIEEEQLRVGREVLDAVRKNALELRGM